MKTTTTKPPKSGAPTSGTSVSGGTTTPPTQHGATGDVASTSSGRAVDAFLSDMERAPAIAPQSADAKLMFILDATMSRQHTWVLAQNLQSEMFDVAGQIGGLEIQLVFFRGQGELRKSSWTDNAAALSAKMQSVRCRGGLTQIGRTLTHAHKTAQSQALAAAVYVGDAMEENPDRLCEIAAQLGLRGVKLFMFQEGRDPHVRATFAELARLTRGAVAQFDAGSADKLRALLRAVAAYASGGHAALVQLAKSDHHAADIAAQITDQSR